MNVLLLAAGSNIAYKVLRCAAEAGNSVLVLGDQRMSHLATSRFCSSYLQSRLSIARANTDALAHEIDHIVASRSIAVVLPGDYESSFILASIRHRLKTRVFPLPDTSILEELHSKWRFNKLCQSLAIPAPSSSLISDRSELARKLAIPNLTIGKIAKPIDKEGRAGFVDFADQTLEASLEQIDYEPILLQDFVPGRDISISLFCQNGRVHASVVYTLDGHSVSFTRHQELERHAMAIADHFKYTGVLCFDGRLTPNSQVSLIECNPRFWNNIDAAMICGINFVALGLADELPSECATIESELTIRKIPLSPRTLRRPWQFSMLDLRFLLYRLRDYPFVLRMRRGASSPALVGLGQMRPKTSHGS